MVFFAVSAVVLLNIYAAILILLRAAVYRVGVYRPMLLNIGLSFAPVVLAVIAVVILLELVGASQREGAWFQLNTVAVWIIVGVGTVLWVLFFPNSIYLITELNFSHRRDDSPVPLWYDIVQTLALTLSGIANAVLSLAIMQTFLTAMLADPTEPGIPWGSWLFAGVVIVLGAVGVYLGRYLRFNSWDVRHPIGMLRKLSAHLRTRGKALEAGAFVLTHAILTALVYAPLYALGVSALGMA